METRLLPQYEVAYKNSDMDVLYDLGRRWAREGLPVFTHLDFKYDEQAKKFLCIPTQTMVSLEVVDTMIPVELWRMPSESKKEFMIRLEFAMCMICGIRNIETMKARNEH